MIESEQEQESPNRISTTVEEIGMREQTTPTSNFGTKLQVTPSSTEKEGRENRNDGIKEAGLSDCLKEPEKGAQEETIIPLSGQQKKAEEGVVGPMAAMEQQCGNLLLSDEATEMKGEQVPVLGSKQVAVDELVSGHAKQAAVEEAVLAEGEQVAVDDKQADMPVEKEASMELFINSKELQGPMVDLMMDSMRPNMPSPATASAPASMVAPEILPPSQMHPLQLMTPPKMAFSSQEPPQLSSPSQMLGPSQPAAPPSQIAPSQMLLPSQPAAPSSHVSAPQMPQASQVIPEATPLEATQRRIFVNIIAVAESESFHAPQAFRMRKHAPLRRLMKTYADFCGLKNPDRLSLRCGDQVMEPDKTPADYGLADGDHVTFSGGASDTEAQQETSPSSRFVCTVKRCSSQYARETGYKDEEGLRKHVLECHPKQPNAKSCRPRSEALVAATPSPAKKPKTVPANQQAESKKICKAKMKAKPKAKGKATAKAKPKPKGQAKRKAATTKAQEKPLVTRKISARVLNQKDALARAEAEKEVPEGVIDSRLVYRGTGSPVLAHGIRKTITAKYGPAQGWRITGFYAHTGSKRAPHKTNLNWRLESPERSRLFRVFKSEKPDVPSLADAVSDGAYQQIIRAIRPEIVRGLKVKRAAVEFRGAKRKRASDAVAPIADAGGAVPLQDASITPERKRARAAAKRGPKCSAPKTKRTSATAATPISNKKHAQSTAPVVQQAPGCGAVTLTGSHGSDLPSAAAEGMGASTRVTQQRPAKAMVAGQPQLPNAVVAQGVPQVPGIPNRAPGDYRGLQGYSQMAQASQAHCMVQADADGGTTSSTPSQQPNAVVATQPTTQIQRPQQRQEFAYSHSQIPNSQSESGMMLGGGSQLGSWACGCLAHLRRHPHCSGNGPFRVHLTRESTVFGRGETCHVALRSTKTPQMISRSHAIIRREGLGFKLADQGSLNGVLVNGERVDGERAIHSGDILTFGVPTAEPEFDYIFEEKQIS